MNGGDQRGNNCFQTRYFFYSGRKRSDYQKIDLAIVGAAHWNNPTAVILGRRNASID